LKVQRHREAHSVEKETERYNKQQNLESKGATERRNSVQKERPSHSQKSSDESQHTSQESEVESKQPKRPRSKKVQDIFLKSTDKDKKASKKRRTTNQEEVIKKGGNSKKVCTLLYLNDKVKGVSKSANDTKKGKGNKAFDLFEDVFAFHEL
jgi:hypothetical protein